MLSGFVAATAFSPVTRAEGANGRGSALVGGSVLILGMTPALVALGNPVYGELMGHYLTQGIGASQRPDFGQGWNETSLDALSNGATPVFVPGQPERYSLIRKAAFNTGGDVQTATLPNFRVEQ